MPILNAWSNTKYLVLWKYNPVTGYWVCQRSVKPADAPTWLGVFRRNVPDGVFKVARNRPSSKP